MKQIRNDKQTNKKIIRDKQQTNKTEEMIQSIKEMI